MGEINFNTVYMFQSITDLPKINTGKVKVGDLYCLSYESEWSRAKVVKVEDNSKVTVIFPDYGNMEVVDISDLLPLAPEMRQLPAQVGLSLAFPYLLSELHLKWLFCGNFYIHWFKNDYELLSGA